MSEVGDAALFGDLILFSPNFWGADEALAAAGALNGKTVIDVANPFEWNPTGRMVRSLAQSNGLATFGKRHLSVYLGAAGWAAADIMALAAIGMFLTAG